MIIWWYDISDSGWNICEVEPTWYTNPGPVSQWPLTADSPSANTADSYISDSEKQVRKFAFCTIKLVEEKNIQNAKICTLEKNHFSFSIISTVRCS